MEIGVWMNTSNAALAAEFSHAMDFWADILDMTWHERNRPDCSIQVVDGSQSLFVSDVIAARTQLVDRKLFHGWIAFNPKCRLSNVETYLTAIHEIGHTLGLPHNPNPKSVMYFLNPEYSPLLDKSDIACLAKHHKLRNPSVAPATLASRFKLPAQFGRN
jgi:Matrixin